METIQDNDITIMMESVPYVEIQMDEDEIIIVDEQEQLNITLDTPEANVVELGDGITVDIFKALQNNAKESTLLEESKAIKNKIANIDLTSVNSKVEEESQTIQSAIQNIDLTPIENKVQEGVNTLSSKIDNIDLTPIESKVDDGVSTLSTKIDNIDLSSVAKQGDNTEATNSKILEEVQNKLTPLEAVLTELSNGKQEMVDAIKSKGGNSNADKSLSEIADDVRNISNIDKTFNNVDFFMAQYGLSMSPMQLIYKHFDAEYLTYVCYVVDAGTKINVQRSAYVMYTADYAIDNPEGEYIIPEWENRFGYFIFAYKSTAVAWENFGAYFIGMYGANTTLDNRTLTNLCGAEFDMCDIELGAGSFNRQLLFVHFGESNVTLTGNDVFGSNSVKGLSIKGLKKASHTLFLINSSINIASFENLEEVGSRVFRGDNMQLYKLNIPKLKIIKGDSFLLARSLREVYAPMLTTIEGSEVFYSCSKLERVYAPNLTYFKNGIVSVFYNTINLIDIEIGEVATSVSAFNSWNPTEVLADADKIAQLDKNIREHIAAKIKDLNGSTAQTFTFHQNVRNIMSEETENAFKTKNWNIAPTKSV